MCELESAENCLVWKSLYCDLCKDDLCEDDFFVVLCLRWRIRWYATAGIVKDRGDLKAERRIISKSCMVEYILLGISGLPLNSVWGTNSGRKRRGVKGMKRFSVHFNLHKPIQIVFFKNFENCRSPFKNETLHQESSEDR